MLGLLLAGAIYVVGIWRQTVEPVQYQVLTTLGTGVFLGTVIASQFAFSTPVLPPYFAFILMLGSIGYTLTVALKAKTQWLGIMASIAGLLAPVLIKVDEPLSALLLTYVFLLSIGFAAVVFFTAWRGISLTLVLGSSFYLSLLFDNGTLHENILWFFVVIFSLLFCATIAVSIFRNDDPDLIDVSMMAIVTLQFILYANQIAIFPDLALFIAAAITGSIGYTLRKRGIAADGVSLFLAASLMCSLIGTAKMFDGYILTIAYAIEALTIYLLSIRLATVPRSVVISALLFVFPFFSGIVNLSAPVWETGIFHVEALGVLCVIITLGFAVVWSVRNQALQAIDWLRKIATGLLVAWYLFAVATSFVVGTAQKSFEEGFMITMLLTTIASMVILYTVFSIPRDSWRGVILLTLIAPTFAATALLSDQAWSTGITHQSFLGALAYLIVLISIMLLYWIVARNGEEQNTVVGNYAYVLLWVVIGYGLLFINTIWDALLSGDGERVVTAVSHVVFIYLIVNVLMLLRVSVYKLLPVLAVLFIPGMMLLPSLAFTGWSKGLMDINAVGLYVTTTMLFLLGTTLLEYRQQVPEGEKESLRVVVQALYVIVGVLIFSLIWIMSQTVFTNGSIAVTLALFVYTVTGLIAYNRGRATGSKVWRRVGFMLLSAVILRLGLVDVWEMELVWRVLTFLGIGLLFIITALVERSQNKVVSTQK